MKKNEPVSKVMTSLLTTVNESDPLSKVRKIFDVSPIHHLPVVSGEELVGIISSNDLMRISFGEFGNQDSQGLDAMLDHTYKLAEVMHRNPTTISVQGTVRDAARILGSHDFHSLPVVDGKKLVGIVTSTDLIKYLAEL